MADWGNAVGQGLAAAANSGVDTIDRQMKEEADNRAANRDLDIKIRLAAATQQLQYQADDRKRALAVQQGKTINEGATGLLNSNVATRINSTLGSAIDPNNPDSKATIETIRNNPDAAKAYGVEPDSDLVKAKARADSARNIGDLSAAAEEDKNVRNLVTDQRNAKTDETANRRLDLMETFQQKMQERQQTLAEATLSYQKRMANSADARATATEKHEMRAATAKALDGANADIKALEKEATSVENMDPANQKRIQSQLQLLRGEAAGHRRALASGGLPAVDAPAAPPEKPTSATDAKLLANINNPQAVAEYKTRFGEQEFQRATASAQPKAAAPAKSAGGLLATAGDMGPTSPTESVGQQLDAARKALSSIGTPPPARDPTALTAWRTKRDELVAQVKTLEQQYQASLGTTSAYFGGK
jgi:hypothetical protein